MYLSEYSSEIKHAVALRFTEYYRWQLSFGEKKTMLRGFHKLIVKAYSKTKVDGIKDHLVALTADGDKTLIRVELTNRLAGVFFLIDRNQVRRLQVVNSFSKEQVLTRVGTFLSDYDAFFRNALELKEKRVIVSAVKRDRKSCKVENDWEEEEEEDILDDTVEDPN